jgi:hypothetical protein
MRLQRSGAIINISSVAARENSYPLVRQSGTRKAPPPTAISVTWDIGFA